MDLLRRTTLSLAALTTLGACAQLPGRLTSPLPVTADGTQLRHRRVRLAPSDTLGFEAIITACVTGARAAQLETAWLCYRESPGRYWLVTFAGPAGPFGEPAGLEGFVEHCAPDALPALRELELEVEWEWEAQKVAAWAIGEEVDLTTHPKARLMVRTTRPGMEAEFAAALGARTTFLADHGYPLPIEGFLSRSGGPAGSLQVVFARDWSSFHADDSFKAFVESLDGDARTEYATRKADLMRTMSRAEFYDADLLPELCYTTELLAVAPGERIDLVVGLGHAPVK